MKIDVVLWKQKLDKFGFVNLESYNICLQTRAQMEKEQKEWHDYDHSKNMDFSKFNYWIIMHDGSIEGFHTFEELFLEAEKIIIGLTEDLK